MAEIEHEMNGKLHQYQDILSAEFGYIAQTAFQANEDRSRSSQFFLITFGTFLVALLSTQFENVDPTQLYLAFSVIFMALAIFGSLTILQITRLRQSWMESVRAMNTIKDSLMNECPSLGQSFRWTSSSIPSPFKPWSIGFLMSLQVSLVSGLAIGSAVAFAGLALDGSKIPWSLSIIIGIAFMALFLILFYILPLRTVK